MTSTGPARHLQLAGSVPRPLPRPVRPLRDEALSSYISRLAAANHLPYRVVLDLLWQHRPGTAADPLGRVRCFAAVTSLDPAAAMMALPELRTGLPSPGRPLPLAGRPVPHLARRAPPCRYCAAAHGAGTGTQVFASAENNVCQAHRTWIGPATRRRPAARAARLPRHHRRPDPPLPPDPPPRAARDIQSVPRRPRDLDHPGMAPRLRHRTRPAHPPAPSPRHQPRRPGLRRPLHHAATYPETIALTAILASPHCARPPWPATPPTASHSTPSSPAGSPPATRSQPPATPCARTPHRPRPPAPHQRPRRPVTLSNNPPLARHAGDLPRAPRGPMILSAKMRQPATSQDPPTSHWMRKTRPRLLTQPAAPLARP